MKKVIYNSSFPRAGSTILQNILAQNPLIYSSPTSGIFQIINNTRDVYRSSTEFLAQDPFITSMGYKGLLKGAIYGYYDSITDKDYAIDKSRAWLGEYKFIDAFDPDPKIICFVRDMRGIYSSLEKKYRENPLISNDITDYSILKGMTTYSRVLELSNSHLISISTQSLYQIILEKLDNNILFIKFEDFCTNPEPHMKKIYSYLQLPYYKHDFNNIEQVTYENDQMYGFYGDHTIQSKLSPIKKDWYDVLGDEVCNMITNMYPWFYEYFNYKI